MMFLNTITKWFDSFCINVLKTGPIPPHVAFIMDGNRRFAKKRHVETLTGHKEGFNTLKEVIEGVSFDLPGVESLCGFGS